MSTRMYQAAQNPARGDCLILLGISSGLFLYFMLTAIFSGYGYFIDEFYYIACSRHLAFGPRPSFEESIRHYVANAHSYPINDLRAVMWRLVVPRAGEPRGSGNFLVGTCPLGLARTAEPRISH